MYRIPSATSFDPALISWMNQYLLRMWYQAWRRRGPWKHYKSKCWFHVYCKMCYQALWASLIIWERKSTGCWLIRRMSRWTMSAEHTLEIAMRVAFWRSLWLILVNGTREDNARVFRSSKCIVCGVNTYCQGYSTQSGTKIRLHQPELNLRPYLLNKRKRLIYVSQLTIRLQLPHYMHYTLLGCPNGSGLKRHTLTIKHTVSDTEQIASHAYLKSPWPNPR